MCERANILSPLQIEKNRIVQSETPPKVPFGTEREARAMKDLLIRLRHYGTMNWNPET